MDRGRSASDRPSESGAALDRSSQEPLFREPGRLARHWLAWTGHYSTIAPFLVRRLRPVAEAPTAPWWTSLEDPELGPVRLTGRLRALEGKELLVVIHGLGGSVRSGYMPLALAAAERTGISCLLLNVRGADLSGEDISHAGLTADLRAVFESPVLAAYERVYLFGYSMGGHLALSYAVDGPDPRLRKVAAISSPLDLDASAQAFDRRRSALYRKHVLGSLKDVYRASFRRRGGPTPLEDVARIRKIRDWDEHVVAPRFGFAGASDYYARVSVAPRLARLELPALYVGTIDDPMVPAKTVRPALAEASSSLEVHWAGRGGHLGFRRDFDLGLTAPTGLEHQVLAWLRS